MSGLPKTERGRRNRITACRAAMREEQRAHGTISDGSGSRYVITWLYFLLDDPKGGKAHLRWFRKTFPDDVGEPVHLLCGALLARRAGDEPLATGMLAELMLANLHVIPHLLAEPMPEDPGWIASSFAAGSYVDAIPEEVVLAVTDDDRRWIKQHHDAPGFRSIRERYMEIHRELAHTREYDRRVPLVREAGALLDRLRRDCR